jgi:hypothetical protein
MQTVHRVNYREGREICGTHTRCAPRWGRALIVHLGSVVGTGRQLSLAQQFGQRFEVHETRSARRAQGQQLPPNRHL